MNRYNIDKVSPKACRDDIIAIMQRNLRHGAAGAIFPWRYENTPYGSAECWMARIGPDGPAVGSAALFQRVFHVDGRPRMVFVAGDFSVDQPHRGFGPAFMLQRRILSDIKGKSGCAWLYGIPNDKSRALFTKLGYRTVGCFRKYLKILKVDYVYKKLNITPNVFMKHLGTVIGALSRERFYRRPKGISVESPDAFDSRFDSLWMAVKHQYPVIGERTAAFLTWRYSESSGKTYKIFCLTRDGILAGYVVYLLLDGLSHVVDLLCFRDRRIVECLISEFSLRMRADGIEAISIRYFGSEYLDGCLRKYNFFRRGKDNDQIMVYEIESGGTVGSLETEEKWYFLDGDGD